MKFSTFELPSGKIVKTTEECVECGTSMLNEDGTTIGCYMTDEKDEDGNIEMLQMCWDCALGDGTWVIKNQESFKTCKHYANSAK